jgi:hypothetical protein
MSEIINTFFRRDESNARIEDFNMNEHIIHLEESAADDAVTRKYIDNSIQAVSDVCL